MFAFLRRQRGAAETLKALRSLRQYEVQQETNISDDDEEETLRPASPPLLLATQDLKSPHGAVPTLESFTGTALVFSFLTFEKAFTAVELFEKINAAAEFFDGFEVPGMHHDFRSLYTTFLGIWKPGGVCSSAIPFPHSFSSHPLHS
jgi:hypothetical protein